MAMESCGDIYALPEDCIATVLSLTSPKDVCRLSVVASKFRSASQSDAVWTHFLPSDIIGDDNLLSKFRWKKDLYLYLSDHPILIDEGRKFGPQQSFSLEKITGKKCYMLAAKDLGIAWGDDTHYWRWIKFSKSRFSEVAKLESVCWFEVRGKINIHILSSDTNYAAYLVFTWESRKHGFTRLNMEALLGISGRESNKRNVRLVHDEERRERQQENIPVDEYPKQRNDGWMEVELGECFVNGDEDEDSHLEVGLLEVKHLWWKGGLVIQGIEIRPKENK